MAATVFLNLEEGYLDIRYFIACLELPLTFFLYFMQGSFFSKYGHQSLDW